MRIIAHPPPENWYWPWIGGDWEGQAEGFGDKGYLFTPREKGNMILNHSSAGIIVDASKRGV